MFMDHFQFFVRICPSISHVNGPSICHLNDGVIQPTSIHPMSHVEGHPHPWAPWDIPGEKVRYPRLGSFEVFVVVQKDFAPNTKLPEIMQVWSKLHLGREKGMDDMEIWDGKSFNVKEHFFLSMF